MRLLVVDDQLTFAETLAARLDSEDGLTVVAVLRSLDELPRPSPEFDVALVGLSDSGTVGASGQDVLRAMADIAPEARIIAMAARTEPLLVAEAIEAGIAGWVPKNLGIKRLLDTIRGVYRDETWIPADILTGVLQVLVESNHRTTDRDTRLSRLTARELAVLQCIVDGYNRAQIAEQLFLSPNTVRTHVQHVLRKFGVHSALSAAAVGRSLGLTPRHGARLAGTEPEVPRASDRFSVGAGRPL